MNTQKIEESIKLLLSHIGEDAEREGLKETPARVARYYKEVLAGYSEDPLTHGTTFENEGNNGLVIVKEIDFYSLCEHHMVPFYGSVAIGYIPDKKILGLSKFARLVEVYARRLQVQERMTSQILEAVQKILQPKGVGVYIEAKHLCMSMRGVRKNGSNTVTSRFTGELETNLQLRNEFLSSI